MYYHPQSPYRSAPVDVGRSPAHADNATKISVDMKVIVLSDDQYMKGTFDGETGVVRATNGMTASVQFESKRVIEISVKWVYPI